jgi:hypothetical protein
MKNRCVLLVVVLFSFLAFGIARAEIEFAGVIDIGTNVVRVDSANFTPPDTAYLTTGWGSHPPMDTFIFTGVPAWPETLKMHGTTQGFPFHLMFVPPDTSTWYHFGSVYGPKVKFFGTGYGGVEESKPMTAPLQRLAVSPSIATGRMTVRLQPVGTGRPVVDIFDAIGNMVRSLDCTTGADGAATATWNREDEFGRLVPEGVYFCRYASVDIVAVRKVLVAH